MSMSEKYPKAVIIEGPQGSGKSTLTARLTERIPNARDIRGIPENDYLTTNTEAEVWLETRNIFREILNNNEGPVICDRQFPSLITYQARIKEGGRRVATNVGLSFFKRNINGHGDNLVIIGLESSVDDCLERQGKGVFCVDRKGLIREIDEYRRLLDELEGNGFNVIRVRNNNTLEKLEEEVLIKLREI